MGDMGISVVIDKTILDKLHLSDKLNSFLKYWLVQEQTKAIVCSDDWNAYEKSWKAKFKEDMVGAEITIPFFASLRGVVYEYEGTLTSRNSHDKTIEIVNRHYATVQYLLSQNPQDYMGKNAKVSDDRILSLKEFYAVMEVKRQDFVQKFIRSYGEVYP